MQMQIRNCIWNIYFLNISFVWLSPVRYFHGPLNIMCFGNKIFKYIMIQSLKEREILMIYHLFSKKNRLKILNIQLCVIFNKNM